MPPHSHSDVSEPLLAGLRPAASLPPRVVSACVLAEGVQDEDKARRFATTQRRLIFALLLALVFMVVEVAGGIYAGSLAIITDAAHLLADVSGFGVSIFAGYYAAKKSRGAFSYGYHRVEVLGALASMATVWLVTGVLVWEAAERVRSPQPVNGKVMFILAVVGIGINVALLFLLGGHGHSHGGHSHSSKPSSSSMGSIEEGHAHTHAHAHDDHAGHDHGNINLRGAVIHVIGDLVQSVGVAIAGALIWWKADDSRWAIADPICTFLFAILVMWTTLTVLRDVADVLMERAPRGMEVCEVEDTICGLPGVAAVHDLHVWSLTLGIPLLCAHVELAPGADPVVVLTSVTAYCRGLGIEHTTLQLVADGGACPCGAPSSSSNGGSRAGSGVISAALE